MSAFPPGPPGPVNPANPAFNNYRNPPPPPVNNFRNEMRTIKSEDIPQQQRPQVMRQVEVQCVAPYSENNWLNIGRASEGVAADKVQYCQALRPPAHLASFVKLQAQSTKGITDTANNTLVFVVMQGEVTVVINASQFVASRGDTFYVPPNNTYNLLNMSHSLAELFLVQYKKE